MIFLDSNLWVYLLGQEDNKKFQVVDKLTDRLDLVVGRQTINETLSILSRKFKYNCDQLRGVVDFFYEEYKVIAYSGNDFRALLEKALDVKEKTHYSYYDSLLLALAILEGCTIFYSEDLQHKQMIDGMEIINPFFIEKNEDNNTLQI